MQANLITVMIKNKTYQITRTFFLFVCSLFIAACTGNKSYKELEHIDSMIQRRAVSSADEKSDTVFKMITEYKDKKWFDKRNEAYFNLLYSISAIEQENESPESIDSMLDISLEYYKNTGEDTRNLTRTYLYKGKLHKLLLEDRKTAMSYLKITESMAVKLQDKGIEHDVFDLMFQIYYDINDYKTAKAYALKTYKTSSDLDSDKLKAYALLNLASVCQDLKEKKECYDYAVKMEPLLHACGKSSLPYILNTIGTVVFNTTNDYNKTMKYFNRSLAERPIPVTYGILAQIEMEMGNEDKAEQMWLKALTFTDNDKNVRMPDANLFALNGMYLFQKSIGHYEEACKYGERIVQVKDSLNIAHQGEAVKEMAEKYDKEVEKNKLNRKIFLSVVTIGLLILIVIGLIIYMRFRANRVKFRLMENSLMISMFRKRVEELETSGNSNEKEVAELRERISELEENQAEILHRGHKLYTMIIEGGTTSTWKQRDFVDVIEYYKIIDLPFVIHLQRDYDHLSPHNQFFEILYHIGFTDNEVKRILGIGQSTIRTTRTRIRKKQLSPR